MLQLNPELLELLSTDTQKFQQSLMGDRFHLSLSSSIKNQKDNERLQLLVQQLLLGLPVEPLLQNYPELAKWIIQLQPIITTPTEEKQLNIVYQKLIQNILVFTRFDLLVAGYDKINAINWSTRENFWDADHLRNSWNTQLSLFLLAENEKVLPENISMTYCFLNCEQLPTIYHFPYNQSQYDCFDKRLQSTLDKLPRTCNAGEHLSFDSGNDEAQSNLEKFAKASYSK